jgi:hypothetical protein
MTDFPIPRICAALALACPSQHKEMKPMKHVTTAASRRKLREATAILGEESMHCILDAFLQNSETPLLGLPDKWRDKAIAEFRQIIIRRRKP